MSERIWNRTLFLTAIAVAIISGVSVWWAWSTSADLASRLSLLALTPVLGAALVSYSLRIVRFYYFLARSGVVISLRDTAVVQAVGFALAVTPGHVGEVFKLHLIRERAGTPLVQTAPLLVLDRLTEGGGFTLLATASALSLPALWTQIPAPGLMLLVLAMVFAFALTRSRWSTQVAVVDSRLAESRLGQRFLPHFRNFWRGLETSFTPKQIAGGLALSTIARCVDGLVILFTAHMFGVELALPAAVLVLAVSGLAGGISFLPAGTGAVETTMVGLLVLLGATWSNALAITLLARLSTLWLWVGLGLVLAFLLRVSPVRARLSEGPIG